MCEDEGIRRPIRLSRKISGVFFSSAMTSPGCQDGRMPSPGKKGAIILHICRFCRHQSRAEAERADGTINSGIETMSVPFFPFQEKGIAVGTGIAARSPHRSVRAVLPHTALTLDDRRQIARSDTVVAKVVAKVSGPFLGRAKGVRTLFRYFSKRGS